MRALCSKSLFSIFRKGRMDFWTFGHFKNVQKRFLWILLFGIFYFSFSLDRPNTILKHSQSYGSQKLYGSQKKDKSNIKILYNGQ
jgi:hypothetical protein